MAGRAGEVYAPLSDSQLSDDWAMNMFPNTHWSTHAEGLLSLEYLPHPTDPLRCRVHIMVLGHRGMNFVNYMPPANDRVEEVRPYRVYTRHDSSRHRRAGQPALVGRHRHDDARAARHAIGWLLSDPLIRTGAGATPSARGTQPVARLNGKGPIKPVVPFMPRARGATARPARRWRQSSRLRRSAGGGPRRRQSPAPGRSRPAPRRSVHRPR